MCSLLRAQNNRAVHMICIFPLLPYSLPILDTGRSACIDDRRLAHLWKSTSLIFGKFHRRRPSLESARSPMNNDIYTHHVEYRDCYSEDDLGPRCQGD